MSHILIQTTWSIPRIKNLKISFRKLNRMCWSLKNSNLSIKIQDILWINSQAGGKYSIIEFIQLEIAELAKLKLLL